METYIYEGPVYNFQICVNPKWKGETRATSVAKARANLAFQYKKEKGLIPSANIRVTGTPVVVPQGE